MVEYEHIKVTLPKDGIDGNYAVIELNRPDMLNALQTKTVKEIHMALEKLEVDKSVRCVVLRGTKDFTKKPAFSAGADLVGGFGEGIQPNIVSDMMLSMQQKLRYYNIIDAFPKPIIAAVDGFALGGGCELTLVCDIIIATNRAVFGFPEIHRGIFPANGGTQRMIRHLGQARVMNMIYFGENVPAQKMHEWGYVSYLTEPGEEFEKVVHQKAKMLGALPTTSLMIIKKAVKFGTQSALSVGLNFEQIGFGLNSASSDVMEGINAFNRRVACPKCGGKGSLDDGSTCPVCKGAKKVRDTPKYKGY
ncbi:MAG: enoyl-CoA hydratase/isomerase family protein [Candidatus Lokiarchaeota archaeon]|nr:enoyl-CoA hydratase/isomerase family protein [Candidatus Lokiarchaeota archaeon]